MTTELATTGETALEPWEQELAEQAAAAAQQEASTGGGQFFSLRGGQLTFNGNQLPDNQMAVLILDWLLVNAYYSERFDPDAPQVPDCYAFGRDEKTMAPHPLVAKPQCETCVACPHNQFGSLVVDGQQRRGKACRNTRRLGLVPGGTLEPGTGRFAPYTTPEQVIGGPLAYLTIPPTSVAGFGNYVKQLAGALNRPPRGVFTKIEVVPDRRTQVKVNFVALGPIPGSIWDAIKTRAREVEAVIAFPFQAGGGDAPSDAPATTPSSGGKASDGKGGKPQAPKRRKY